MGLAIELYENANAIEAWRATLPERQRRRLIHPLSNVRRWRQWVGRKPPESGAKTTTGDLQREALTHWHQFCRCIEALPPDQAAHVWRTVEAEIIALRRTKQ